MEKNQENLEVKNFSKFVPKHYVITLLFPEVESMRTLSDNTIAVCGTDDDEVKLTKYDMQGNVVLSTRLEHSLFDMVEILLVDKPCLAIVYG